MKEVERRLRVNDAVMKFITVRIDEKLKKIEKRKKAREKRAARKPAPAWRPPTSGSAARCRRARMPGGSGSGEPGPGSARSAGRGARRTAAESKEQE